MLALPLNAIMHKVVDSRTAARQYKVDGLGLTGHGRVQACLPTLRMSMFIHMMQSQGMPPAKPYAR